MGPNASGLKAPRAGSGGGDPDPSGLRENTWGSNSWTPWEGGDPGRTHLGTERKESGPSRGPQSRNILVCMGWTLTMGHLGVKNERTVPQLLGIGWGSSQGAAPTQPTGTPTPLPRTRVGEQGPSPWQGARRVRSVGKVTRGDAPPPPPFVPPVGGGAMVVRGPSGGCARPRVQARPPPSPADAPGQQAGAPRSPTSARNWARGPTAAAPMPSAGERLQSVAGRGGKRPPSADGRGGRGGEPRGGR